MGVLLLILSLYAAVFFIPIDGPPVTEANQKAKSENRINRLKTEPATTLSKRDKPQDQAVVQPSWSVPQPATVEPDPAKDDKPVQPPKENVTRDKNGLAKTDAKPGPPPKTSTPEPPRSLKRHTLNGVEPRFGDRSITLNLKAEEPISDYRFFFVAPGNKLVIDFPGVWRVKAIEDLKTENALVTAIRFGKHPRFFRVVFDLKGKIKPSPVFVELATGVSVTIEVQ